MNPERIFSFQNKKQTYMKRIPINNPSHEKSNSTTLIRLSLLENITKDKNKTNLITKAN